MRWDDGSIVGFARRANFAGGQLDTAIAVALATSGGDDAYEYTPIFGPRHHWVGMWGIDVLAYPQFDASLMRNPVYCAEAAYYLTRLNNQGWVWSQAFTSGAYKRYAAEAVAAETAPSPAQYGFALGGDDLDSSGLAGLAASGHESVSNLSRVVGGL